MKKITLLFALILTFVSCSKSKEEQMLFNYQQKNAKLLNFDIKDLDLKIKKIEKTKEIKASDSAKFIKKKLASYWKKNPEQSLIDTLSFKYVKSILNKNISQSDTLIKLYQKAVLTAIKLGDYSYEIESKNKRDKEIDDKFSLNKTLIEIEELEKYYNSLIENPDSILSIQYKAEYSIKNPLLNNTKQIFEKYFYTDSKLNTFIKEEEIKN